MCIGSSTIKGMGSLPEKEKLFVYDLIFASGFMSKGIMDVLPVSEKCKFEEVLPIEHLERQDVSFRAWIIDLFLNLIIEEIFHADRHKSKRDLQFKMKSAIHCFMDKGQKRI